MQIAMLSVGPFAMLLVATALRLVAAAQPETAWSGRTRQTLIIASYATIAASLTGMAVLLFVVGPLGGAGVLICTLLISGMIEADVRNAGTQRRAREAEFLWLLAIAARSGRPLADEIDAYAQGTWGLQHRRLMEMAERLRDGVSLSEVVVPNGLLPAAVRMQIHSGINSKTFQESLHDTAARATRELEDEQERGQGGLSLLYPAMLIPVMMLIVGFLMYYIIPKFKKIFEDFGTELPRMTISLIKTSDLIVNYWYVFLPPMFWAAISLYLVTLIAENRGWQVVLQTIFGRFFARCYASDILRALSQSVSQGIPLDKALKPIVRFYGPVHLRKRLAWIVESIEDGADGWQALRNARILTSAEAAALSAAQRVGNLPWTMASIADSIERRSTFRLRIFLECMKPVLMLAIAFGVGMIAISIFMPLIKLLNDLS